MKYHTDYSNGVVMMMVVALLLLCGIAVVLMLIIIVTCFVCAVVFLLYLSLYFSAEFKQKNRILKTLRSILLELIRYEGLELWAFCLFTYIGYSMLYVCK